MKPKTEKEKTRKHEEDAIERSRIKRAEFLIAIRNTNVNDHTALDKILSEAVLHEDIDMGDYIDIQAEACRMGWGGLGRLKVTYV